MKKFILITIIILFSTLLYAADVQIYQNGKQIGTMSKEQFTELVRGAENYKEIMEAQNKNRIRIIANKIETTEDKNVYKCTFRFSWKNQKQEEINYVVSDLLIQIDDEMGMSNFRIYYRNISEIGFPISISAIFLILILL